MAKRLILLLGGARSGKSHYAENWARGQGGRVLFVAAAEARDDDMRERIAAHRATRPAAWHTLEAPRDTARQIADCDYAHDTLLLDCLTLLTSNILLDLPESATQHDANAAALAEVELLLEAYAASKASWLVVSNEVGMGVVPPTRLGTLYRDMLGRANQRVAQAADEVLLLMAGLPWRLK
ncbi:MAG: bifunctional adenosylcobinamide kinase/adenosylcobinamide-phosphate guanylyltransferase [Chloroflexi bacterium]|nr:bifunctional adenosylcobinamide kinase/adenosylcobinamide-phosphate guanylyltransferase [Chloroflexota bacterium]